jgi:SEC-C motif-containing protein
MSEQLPCPCGSNKIFAECCMPILQGSIKAETAEQLMRSRYTAFSEMDNEYLLASWAVKTRPEQLDTDEAKVKWIKLEITETEQGAAKDSSGTVSFIASFIASGHLCKMQEKSRFIKEEDMWFYLDGIPKSSTKKIARNSLCPCGSEKKFKRCCL